MIIPIKSTSKTDSSKMVADQKIRQIMMVLQVISIDIKTTLAILQMNRANGKKIVFSFRGRTYES